MRLIMSDVTKIELANEFPSNDGCRTVRITTKTLRGDIEEHEVSFFGQTEALAGLPRTATYFNSDDEAELAVAAE